MAKDNALYGQTRMFGDELNYKAFTDKFVPAKTTDDCYTPPLVYEAVADWVAREYGLDADKFVRPFYPGGDFEREEYPDGCVVVDNPPFSILSRICRFYVDKGIRFFLFAPTLTLFSGKHLEHSCCYIPVGASVIYDNGADVNTSFITNLDEWQVRTAPGLYAAVRDAVAKTQAGKTAHLPKYVYPDYVITSAIVSRWCKYGVEYRLKRSECVRIHTLDAMQGQGKKSGIFGYGFLLSERAAAERATAERAAIERNDAMRWELSDREKRIVAELGKREDIEKQDKEGATHEHTDDERGHGRAAG